MHVLRYWCLMYASVAIDEAVVATARLVWRLHRFELFTKVKRSFDDFAKNDIFCDSDRKNWGYAKEGGANNPLLRHMI